MSLDKSRFTELIKNFKFSDLFNELGWDRADKEELISVDEDKFRLKAVSEKRGFVIFVCSPCNNGKIPLYNTRKKIDSKITRLYFEHLIIYTDKDNFQQIWQLVIREADKPIVVRETPYFQSQQPELLFQRLRGIFISLDEEEKITIADVKSNVREQFNTNSEKVTKKFYVEFKNQHTAFIKFILGIESVVDRDWYASLMLNRLMFIYFIQKKGFLDDNFNYLNDKLKETQTKKGKDKFYSFYRNFLLVLFHKGLGSPDRDDKLLKEIGKVPYLNGGLFDVHQIEEKYRQIEIGDKAFQKIFDFFDEYNWHLDTRITATGKDVNPDVIGYIFEKYINDRASMGAYYTKEDITEYISKNTIIPFLFDEVKKECSIAFKDESSIWKMLKDNPDRYIYDAVKHGIYITNTTFLECPAGGYDKQIRELPEEISIGLDTTKPNLLERRKNWNKPASSVYALPTEIWREVVERRNRYFEIKKKIENDEIRDINDFITYNLNIRQFAQDAVVQYEGSDFVNAFYKAIKKITILDPTCGSGAFLFAALNILEPLYESSMQRMRGFVEEDDLNGGRKFSQFRQVLKEIENHPNEKYYIYKSIILNNLYGVDIMNEAVEIAKLRLFLKLVSEVEDFNHLEPLPDIDFNIRTGNTLIGFATKEELDKGLTWSLNLDIDKQKIYDELDIVSKSFKRYKEIQLEDKTDHTEFRKAKDELINRLKMLDDILNDYLGNDYGKTRKKVIEFDKWLISYKPFHWFAEFYEIINDKSGFDVIIGNPPYVEYKKIEADYRIKDYKTINCGNLYAFVMERCQKIIKKGTQLSMIIPLASFSTNRMLPLQKIYIQNGKKLFLSNFEATSNPSTLFIGVKIQLSIIIWKHVPNNQCSIMTTNYLRSYSEERPYLFQKFSYVPAIYYNNILLRCYHPKERIIWNKLIEASKYNNDITGYKNFYYRNMGNFFFKLAFLQEPKYYKNNQLNSSSTVSVFQVKNELLFKVISEINSTMFYYYWVIYSDCYHLSKNDIINFPFSNKYLENNNTFENLCKTYLSSLEKSAIWQIEEKKDGTIKKYRRYFPQASKYFADEIDKEISQHYNFTSEELDFIINYDIKYRMGKQLEEGEND